MKKNHVNLCVWIKIKITTIIQKRKIVESLFWLKNTENKKKSNCYLGAIEWLQLMSQILAHVL